MIRSNPSLLLWVLLALLAGCLPAERQVIPIPVVAGGSEGGTLFVASDGTQVTVQTAVAHIVHLLFIHPDELAARRSKWTLISRAYAHPGHAHAENMQGELFGDFVVDLTAAPQALGEAHLFDGSYIEAELRLASSLQAVSFAGTAVLPDGSSKPFSAAVAGPWALSGLPFEAEVTLGSGPAEIRVVADLAAMLSWVDWSVADEDEDGALTSKDTEFALRVAYGTYRSDSWHLQL